MSDNIQAILSVDNNTMMITGEDQIKEQLEKMYISVITQYTKQKGVLQSALDVKQGSSGGTTSTQIEEVMNLGQDPQNDLKKILQINSIIKRRINVDDLIGITYDSLQANVKGEYKLSYKNLPTKSASKVKKAKIIVDTTNELLKIKRNIKKSVLTTYTSGNCILYLRTVKKNGQLLYILDYFPVGVALITSYRVDGDPVVVIDMKEFNDKLNAGKKYKNKNKSLFFKNMDEEIKNTYPEEIYKAFKNKDAFAQLDPARTFVMQVGNINGAYGVTPMFKALKSALILDDFEKSDSVNSRIRAKKILFQSMARELLTNGIYNNTKNHEDMAFAHNQLVQAWKQPVVVLTQPPSIQGLEYVEPKIELTNVNSYKLYMQKMANALGIGFLYAGTSQTVTTASLSIKQLLNTINYISEQFEEAMAKFYKVIFEENHIDFAYIPDLKIIDNEQLEMDMRMSLATLLAGTLNSSMETAYDVLGFNASDEALKLKHEQELGYDDLFKPHETSFNKTKEVGRPQGQNEEKLDKQVYDKNRNS